MPSCAPTTDRPTRVGAGADSGGGRLRRAGLVAALVGLFAALASRPHASAERVRGARVDRIEVDKSEGRLRAYDGARLVHEEVAAIGHGGAGQKQNEGDGRTPTGRFRIVSRSRSRRFGHFLALDYPRPEDRARFAALRREGGVPAGRGVGHSIGLHGESDRPMVRWLNNRVNWTAGCVAVRDETAAWLARSAVPGVVVLIRE